MEQRLGEPTRVLRFHLNEQYYNYFQSTWGEKKEKVGLTCFISFSLKEADRVNLMLTQHMAQPHWFIFLFFINTFTDTGK